MSRIVVDRRRRAEEVQRIGQKQRKRKINGLAELLRRVNEEGGEVLLFPRGDHLIIIIGARGGGVHHVVFGMSCGVN